MHKKRILNIFLMLFTSATIASAAPFTDISSNHWAYQAVSEIANKGLIQGFPNESFRGNENLSRYQLAIITSKMLANLEQNGINSISKNDLQTIEKLTMEFADELAILGVNVTDLKNDMQVVKENIADLKKEVNSVKNVIGNGNIDKVRLSGDFLIRNFGNSYDRGSKNG